MKGWKFEVTEADGIHVEGLGLVTGTATYSPGHPGSRWQPPDPPELEDPELLAGGEPIPEEVWDDPDFYDRLLGALWPVIQRDFYDIAPD